MKALVSQAQAAGPVLSDNHGYDNAEKELTAALHSSQAAFRAALCDSFNTPEAMTVLRDIVSQANVYVTSRGKGRVNIEVVERVARWVGDMLKMFGLGEGQSKEIGWGDVREDGAEGNVSAILFTQD